MVLFQQSLIHDDRIAPITLHQTSQPVLQLSLLWSEQLRGKLYECRLYDKISLRFCSVDQSFAEFPPMLSRKLAREVLRHNPATSKPVILKRRTQQPRAGGENYWTQTKARPEPQDTPPFPKQCGKDNPSLQTITLAGTRTQPLNHDPNLVMIAPQTEPSTYTLIAPVGKTSHLKAPTKLRFSNQFPLQRHKTTTVRKKFHGRTTASNRRNSNKKLSITNTHLIQLLPDNQITRELTPTAFEHHNIIL